MGGRSVVELLPVGEREAFAFVARTLDLSQVAHEEIESAKRESPEHGAELRRLFPVLVPGEVGRFGATLYRVHARELCERVLDGLDLRPGTDAEILAVLSNASLKAPLTVEPAALFEAVFARCFDASRVLEGGPRPEPWQGSNDELARTLRRKIARLARRPRSV